MHILAIIFLAVAAFPLGRANDACDSRFHIISSLTQKHCPADRTSPNDPNVITHKYYLVQDGGDQKCFPYCREIKTGLTTNLCSPKAPCPPAYECHVTTQHCVLQETSCLKYHVNYDKRADSAYFGAMWKPECLPDGTWAPKQCKGEKFTGRCFCFDAIGNRIDGNQWATKSENMTCACSRKRSEMVKDKSIPFVSLHCDDEGNYEPLQCNDGQCWCAEPKTGEVVSKIVVEKMWNTLPCYDADQHGAQYLRQCESQLYAQKRIVAEMVIHGTVGFKYDYVLCDADGTYGVYRIGDGKATCTWKDDKPLGSFVTDLSGQNTEVINCNCARDGRIYELANLDPELRGRCNGNGNYLQVQIKVLEGGKPQYYCVDTDGYQKSPFLDKSPTSCTKYK